MGEDKKTTLEPDLAEINATIIALNAEIIATVVSIS